MDSEIEKLKKRAQILGIDVELLVKEIAAEVGRALPPPPPAGGVNVDAIVERVTEKVEGKLGASLRTALTDAMEKMDQRYQQIINSTIQNQIPVQFQVMKEGLLQKMAGIFAQQQASVAQMNEQPGQSSPQVPQGGQQSGSVDKYLPIIELLLKSGSGGNPIEQLKEFVSLKQQLDSIFNPQGAPGASPSSDLLFRSNQQAFMEGVKLGAKGRGPVPLPSNPPKSGGSLTTPGGQRSGDDIIDTL